MLSPSNWLATCSASNTPSSSAPTAWAMAASQPSAGNCQLGLCTKAAAGVPWLLRATNVRPGCMAASVALFAATMGSQPITRSALAVSTLVVWMASGRLAICTWLQVEPPFCARPAASCVMTPLPSRCAAMPSRDPMVITPVPPTPATTMPHAASAAGSTGSGMGAIVDRSPFFSFLGFLSWPPSTVTKLGQKPFTQE